jgi:DNA-directed RNA polymerase specialized sigma24 family protein
MDSKEILTKFVRSGELLRIARQIALPDHAPDLAQETILILLEKPERKIEDLHREGMLTFFVVRTMINLYRSNDSPFARKYRHFAINLDVDSLEFKISYEPFIGDRNELSPEGVEVALRFAFEEMQTWDKTKFPTKRLLFEAFLRSKSKKDLSRKTGIPYRTIVDTIDKLRNKLKQNVRNRLDDIDDFDF